MPPCLWVVSKQLFKRRHKHYQVVLRLWFGKQTKVCQGGIRNGMQIFTEGDNEQLIM
jgi:hypothetical protein